MRILLTGFGPFPGVPHNPSQAVVELLSTMAWREPVRLETMVLPTEYEAASQRLTDGLLALRPDACICLGVGKPGAIRLETLARNRDLGSAADRVGEVRAGPIERDGPAIYQSTLPLRRLERYLRRESFPVEYSGDAGGYVCNHCFYVARHLAEAQGAPRLCGFIHLPNVVADVGTSLTPERLAAAIRVVVECVSTGELETTVSLMQRAHGASAS